VYFTISKHFGCTVAVITTIFIILFISKTVFFGSLIFGSNNVWAETSNDITKTIINPTIDHISDIISNAAASSSATATHVSKQDLKQTLSQVFLLSEDKAGKDKAQQFLSHIAEQVALNPRGPVPQSLIRFVQEDNQEYALLNQTISAALVTNTPIPIALTTVALSTINGATENTIDTLSKHLASSTGIGTEAYREVLQQLALSISNTDGKDKANELITYQLPQAVLQAHSRQIVQPLSSFAWNLQYGHISTLDDNSLQSSLTVIPSPGGSTYDSSSSYGNTMSSPNSPFGSPLEEHSSPLTTTNTPQQDLRSMDSMGGTSSDQGQQPSSPLGSGSDSTPQQDLRSMDSGNGNSLPSSSNNEGAGGSESSYSSTTPQEDLRSMDSSQP
jgi:hypothetical protein